METKKIKFKYFYWIFFYLLVFFFILYNSFDYLDPDLGWHLRVGENIITEKAVPGPDYYNYTLEGQKWVDHEWLFDAIIFEVYSNFGYIALSLLFALIFLLTLILLHIFSHRNFSDKKNNFFVFSFFIALGAICLAPHSGVRVQEISVLGLLLLIIILFYYAKNKNYKILFFLLPLFFLWSNLHAGFILGVFIMFFFLFIKVAEHIFKKIKFFNFLSSVGLLNKKNLTVYAIFAVLGSLTTLLTPYGLKIIDLFGRIHVSGAFHLRVILEWLPAYSLPINYWQLIYSAIATIFISLFIISSASKKKNAEIFGGVKINLWFLVLSSLFLILAFKAKRHFPFFFIASFPLIINFCNIYFYSDNKKIKQYLTGNHLLNFFIIASLFFASILFIIKTNFTAKPFNSAKFCSAVPCAGTAYLKKHPEYKNYKLFNQYGWGGYLIWQWPGKKLFIDGRLPQYPFAGHTLLAEYYEFFSKEKTEIKLNEYNIKAVLINTPKTISLNWFEEHILGYDKTKFKDKKYYLKDYLDNDASWQKVYEDNVCLVYINNE